MSVDNRDRGLVASEAKTPLSSEANDDRYYAIPVTVNRRVGELGLGAMFGLFSLLNAFPPNGEGFHPWLTVPAFSLVSLHFLARGISERPRLTMDADGILDRTSIAGGPLRILWADVLSVSTSRWTKTVRLEVRDPKILRARAGLRRRLELWVGTLFGNRTIWINTTLLGVSSKQLKERLEAELLRFERGQLGFPVDQMELPPEG